MASKPATWLMMIGLLFRMLVQSLVVPLLIIGLIAKTKIPSVFALVALFAYFYGVIRWHKWRESRLATPSARARYRQRDVDPS